LRAVLVVQLRDAAETLIPALTLHLDRAKFAESLGVDPDPWQRDLLASTSKRILLNCSRQSGKSMMAAILALHRALYWPDSLVLCLAPALRQSQELYAKVATFYRGLASPGSEAVAAKGERRLSLELENGSRIITLPGTEKTIRGFSGAALLLVDEAARVDDGLYYAVRPMLAVSGGSIVMLSTPWGKRGVFYEEWAHGGEWGRYKLTAEECPRISPAFLAEEARTLPHWVYQQEYHCSFEETEDQVFQMADIERAFTTEPEDRLPDEETLWT
jgi:Terminase large subunit, T4likevirus-type, N-terminal